MSRQVRSGTNPEMALRRELHRRGRRFRVNHKIDVDGLRRRRADVVFTRWKVAVFVDGCFWHRCPEHSTSPTANHDWWEAKLRGNVDRDRDTDAKLTVAGWIVVRAWEHENVDSVADRVEVVLDGEASRTAPERCC